MKLPDRFRRHGGSGAANLPGGPESIVAGAPGDAFNNGSFFLEVSL